MSEMSSARPAGLRKRLVLPEMEGAMARWYSKQRGTPSQVAAWRKQAAHLTAGLREGADILEVAPGPGYLAIEMAGLGRFKVTGLDISHTMVEIAGENAHKASVVVDFRHGDAGAMPFPAESFDFIVSQAAFKNSGSRSAPSTRCIECSEKEGWP